MGRAFEFRKERKLKRWSKMAVQFTKLSKEITIAVKSGGANPENNFRLRTAIQNARGANMPKDNVENAIKKGLGTDQANYDEIIYQGYAPHTVAIIIEAATDNVNRTAANIRSYFTRSGGSLGKTGSLDFMFERRSIFVIEKGDFDIESLEFELIDFGLKEFYTEEEEIVIEAEFSFFGAIQKKLEEKTIKIINSKLEYIPLNTIKLEKEQAEEVLHLIEKVEEDEDVQVVFHNLEV